jgi:nucleoside-diphosphate-sugar epimerase
MTKIADIPYESVSLAGERVLLVGGAGFIGHHFALELRRKGAEVMILDHFQINNIVKIVTDTTLDPIRRQLYSNFLLDRLQLLRDAGVHLETVDARMFPEFAKAFNTFLPTKAVHLSAISSALAANKVPGLAYDLQITTLRILLELCQLRESVCNQVQFLSSSTVYGDFEGDSVDETVRPQPKGVYANGKYMGERMVREANRLFGIDYTIIRPSALYGIRCISGRVSQKFVENALRGTPLLLEGGGGGMLDFTHIDDLIEGMLRSLAVEGGRSRTFNITYGNARSIAELANIIKEIIPQAILEERPAAPEKPKRGTLHIHRAKEYLGFVPSRPLETGYREYCSWYVDEWNRAKKMIGN